MKEKLIILRNLLYFVIISLSVHAQGKFTAVDYNNADSLVDSFDKKVFHSVQRVNWVEGKPIFWYSTLTAQGREFWTVNGEKLTKEKLFETEFLLAELFKITGKSVKNEDFSPGNPKLSADGNLFTFQVDTLLFEWNRAKCELKKTGTKPPEKPRKY